MLNTIMINLMMQLKKDSGAGFEKLKLNSLMKSLEEDGFFGGQDDNHGVPFYLILFVLLFSNYSSSLLRAKQANDQASISFFSHLHYLLVFLPFIW